MGSFSGAAGAGDVCGAWQAYECCLKDAFSSCGSSLQQQISIMMDTTKTQFNAQLPGLASCAAATCSSGGSSAPTAATEVETILMATIQMADPLAFDLTKYMAAVKKATGVSHDPIAVLKAFEIAIKYVVPDGTELAALKAAVAKVNSITESQVTVAASGVRRLGAGRRLGMNVDVTITVPDATKAAAVKTSAATATGLESELGGTVSVAQAPVATAKVETKVRSAPSVTSQLATKIQSAGTDIGGTVTAEVQAAPPAASSNSASSKFSVILATVVILFRAAM